MRFLRFLPFIAVGFLLILHGFAHTPAILGSWDLATFDDVSRQPNALFTNASEGLLVVLGLFWLIAALSFVAAGVGLIRQTSWWPLAAGIALVVSTTMTLLWHNDAVVGLVLNIILLAAFMIWVVIGTMWQQQPA